MEDSKKEPLKLNYLERKYLEENRIPKEGDLSRQERECFEEAMKCAKDLKEDFEKRRSKRRDDSKEEKSKEKGVNPREELDKIIDAYFDGGLPEDIQEKIYDAEKEVIKEENIRLNEKKENKRAILAGKIIELKEKLEIILKKGYKDEIIKKAGAEREREGFKNKKVDDSFGDIVNELLIKKINDARELLKYYKELQIAYLEKEPNICKIDEIRERGPKVDIYLNEVDLDKLKNIDFDMLSYISKGKDVKKIIENFNKHRKNLSSITGKEIKLGVLENKSKEEFAVQESRKNFSFYLANLIQIKLAKKIIEDHDN